MYEEGRKVGIKIASHVPEERLQAAKRLGITIGREQVYAEHAILRVSEVHQPAQLETPPKPLLLGTRQVAAQHGFPIGKIALLPEFIPTDKLPKLTQEQRAAVDWLNSDSSELLPTLTKEQRAKIARLDEQPPQPVEDEEDTVELKAIVTLMHQR